MIDPDDRESRMVHADAIGGPRGELIVLGERVMAGTATSEQFRRYRELREPIHRRVAKPGIRVAWDGGIITRLDLGVGGDSHIDDSELDDVTHLEVRGSGTVVAAHFDRFASLRWVGLGNQKWRFDRGLVRELGARGVRGFGIWASDARAICKTLAELGIRDLEFGAPGTDATLLVQLVNELPDTLERVVVHADVPFTTVNLVRALLAKPALRAAGLAHPSGVGEDWCEAASERGLLAKLTAFGASVADDLARYREALAGLDVFAALTFNDDGDNAIRAFAAKLRWLGRITAALALYDLQITDPIVPTLLTERAGCLQELGHSQLAHDLVQEALEIEPDDERALLVRAQTLHGLARWADAVDAWQRVEDRGRTDYVVLGNRACALRRLGRYDETFDTFDRMLALDPRHEWTTLERALTLGQIRDERAATALQAVADNAAFQNTTRVSALHQLAVLAIGARDVRRAIAFLECALPLTTENDRNRVQRLYVNLLDEIGETSRAQVIYRAMVDDEDPDIRDQGYSGCGWALLALGRPDEALGMFQSHSKHSLAHGEALALLGLGRAGDALAALAAAERTESCPYQFACYGLARAAIHRITGDTAALAQTLRDYRGAATTVRGTVEDLEARMAERPVADLVPHRCANDGTDAIGACGCRTAAVVAMLSVLAGVEPEATERIEMLEAALRAGNQASTRLYAPRGPLPHFELAPDVAARIAHILHVVEGQL